MVLSMLNFTRIDLLQMFGLAKYGDSFIFEIIDMIIMSLAIGYIFSGYLKRSMQENYDPLKHYNNKLWEDIKYAAIAAGPAVVLHELAHKFVAMAFGAKAILFAPYGFYLLVIILKAIGFPFLFFVGGFVMHSPLPAIPSAIVSIAGPLMNLIMWYLLGIGMKNGMIQKKYYYIAIHLARISIFLAIFNMLPIPGFDGFNFLSSLFSGLF